MTHRKVILVAAGLILLTTAVFWPVRHHDFVSFDDSRYITENSHIQKGITWNSVKWAFSTTYANFWHPLTWLSHMVDYQIFGLKPAGHHLSNLFLHTINAVLLFLVLLRMTDDLWPSALVAALFALHPLHVESVAWASERKDVLSTLFWILTMGSYVSFVRRRNWGRYALVFLCYLLGLMAKPMLVTLPFALILIDYWPLGRLSLGQKTMPTTSGRSTCQDKLGLSSIMGEKIPLLLVAAVFSTVAFLAQAGGGATKSLQAFPVDVRVTNTLVSYVKYLGKTLWPSDLSVFYPHPGATLAPLHGVLAAVVLLAVTILILWKAKVHPYLPVGWFWFLGTLVPVTGLVQVGDHGMADRYTYVPLIGLFIMLSWGGAHMARALKWRPTAVAGTALLLVSMLGISSWFQVAFWKNSVTLFDRALAVGPPSALTHTDLGEALAFRGELDKAVWHCEKALAINPDYLAARVNLGGVLARQGKLDEAMVQYREALRIKPDFPGAHYNMANALARQGKLEAAIASYREAMVHSPDDRDIHNNLGIALALQAKTEEAIFHFQRAIQIDPNFAAARQNLDLAMRPPDHNRPSLRR